MCEAGFEALLDGDAARAVTILRAAESSTLVNRALCEALLQTNAYAEALDVAKKLGAAEPTCAAHGARKGRALFGLGEFESARDAFVAAGSLSGADDKLLSRWIRRCDAELETEDLPAPTPTSSTSVTAADSAAASSTATASSAPAAAAAAAAAASSSASSSSSSSAAPAFAPYGYIRRRFDWYQTPDTVVLTLVARGARATEAGAIVVEPSSDGSSFGSLLAIDMAAENAPQAEADGRLRLRLSLCEEVECAVTRIEVRSMNVEVTLTKRRRGLQWAALQRPEPASSSSGGGGAVAMAVSGTAVGAGVVAQVTDPREAERRAREYPSSKGSRDWDHLERSIEKAEEEEDKPDGEDALQKLFRQIYRNANADTRRAMNKSFQTSKGTVLSTNWSEVAKTDYEKQPPDAPDGASWKKWDD